MIRHILITLIIPIFSMGQMYEISPESDLIGEIYTIKQLANIIASKVKYNGKILFNRKFPNGVHKKNIDISRIKKLNWRSKFDLSKGLDIVLRELRV